LAVQSVCPTWCADLMGLGLGHQSVPESTQGNLFNDFHDHPSGQRHHSRPCYGVIHFTEERLSAVPERFSQRVLDIQRLRAISALEKFMIVVGPKVGECDSRKSKRTRRFKIIAMRY